MTSNILKLLALSSVYLLVWLSSDIQVESLECYICQNQDDNKNKCVETVKTCELDQDQCLSEVRWGSSPSWGPTGQKQFYISKRCATKLECNEAIADKQGRCDRIHYNDWNCTSCCSGDKCNHYVTLSGNLIQMNILLMTTGILVALYSAYFL